MKRLTSLLVVTSFLLMCNQILLCQHINATTNPITSTALRVSAAPPPPDDDDYPPQPTILPFTKSCEIIENNGPSFVVASCYLKKIISTSNCYDYGPTAMQDEDGTYKMWWTGGYPDLNIWDHIYYAYSSNCTTWTGRRDVMSPSPLALTADPTVVKVNGTYFMYFTGTWNSDGTQNDIYLATSTNGINWTKYPSNSNPQPVIARQSPGPGLYGAGQPSVIYKDGQFILYYLDQTAPIDGLYRAVSSDGVNFSNHSFVLGINDVDVKYSETYGIYVMVRPGQYGNDVSRAWLHLSYDGLNFTPIDNSKFILGAGICNDFVGSSGIIGSPHGIISSRTKLIFCSGIPSQSDAKTWDLYMSEFWFFPSTPNMVYRYYSSVTQAKDNMYFISGNSAPYYSYVGKAWISPLQTANGASPLFMLYNTTTQDHLYTASVAEKNTCIAAGWQDHGIVGYVFNQQTTTTVPIYRLYRTLTGDHFYTTNAVERDTAIHWQGYSYEGIAGYAYPAE